jgi:hypothetical protein
MKLTLKERKLVKEYTKRLVREPKNLTEGVLGFNYSGESDNAAGLWEVILKSMIRPMQLHLKDDPVNDDFKTNTSPAMDCALILRDLFRAKLEVSTVTDKLGPIIAKKLESELKTPDLDRSYKNAISKMITFVQTY